MKKMRLLILLAGIGTMGLAFPAWGVLVGPGDGTQNTTGVGMVGGWDNVGKLGSASAVYLGNGWVITARHVSGGGTGTAVTFGSTTYHSDGQAVRLQTPGQGDADLLMFHLDSLPTLPSLTIAANSPTIGTFIYMAGYGRNRAADPTYYDVTQTSSNPDHYSWTPVSDPDDANAGGFAFGSGSTKRWGTNLTSGDPDHPGNATDLADAGYGKTQIFFANFYDDLADYRNDGGTASEGQLVNGDSGGGVFNSAGELIGLNNYKITFTDQSDTDAIFGNGSGMADLSVYRNQILSVMAVPEPAGLILLACGSSWLMMRRKRRV